MSSFYVSIPANWEEFVKGLAYDHNIDVSKVLGGLCDWVFSSPEYKRQFEVWLGTVYPPKGQAEDRARVKGEQACAKRIGMIKLRKKSTRTETTVKIEN
jgi:hypothetical protein